MEEKYIVHISGPDDIFGPYTEFDALKIANEINITWLKKMKKDRLYNIVLHVATVRKG